MIDLEQIPCFFTGQIERCSSPTWVGTWQQPTTNNPPPPSERGVRETLFSANDDGLHGNVRPFIPTFRLKCPTQPNIWLPAMYGRVRRPGWLVRPRPTCPFILRGGGAKPVRFACYWY